MARATSNSTPLVRQPAHLRLQPRLRPISSCRHLKDSLSTRRKAQVILNLKGAPLKQHISQPAPSTARALPASCPLKHPHLLNPEPSEKAEHSLRHKRPRVISQPARSLWPSAIAPSRLSDYSPPQAAQESRSSRAIKPPTGSSFPSLPRPHPRPRSASKPPSQNLDVRIQFHSSNKQILLLKKHSSPAAAPLNARVSAQAVIAHLAPTIPDNTALISRTADSMGFGEVSAMTEGGHSLLVGGRCGELSPLSAFPPPLVA